MNEQAAVLLGATGLTGNYLLQELLADDDFRAVRILVRNKLAINHPKLEQEIVDFNNLEDYRLKFGKGDVIFCCIGTTTKKVNGDHAAYKKIDFDIPYNAAMIGISNGFKKFLVISSAGANEHSRNFYLALKGEIENALKAFSFESMSIFRPGQLLGERKELRKGEKILQSATIFISHFLFGSFKKYHSIHGKEVAKAMVAQSKKRTPGFQILGYDEMKNLLH